MLQKVVHPMAMKRKGALSNRLKQIDWDFAGLSCASAFAVAHWHPCRFVAQIPASLIGLLSNKGDTVLDPFAGAGTTLVEAQRLGRQAIGIDINPIATLISRSKLSNQSALQIERAVNRYKRVLLEGSARKVMSRESTSAIPKTVQLDKWYHKETGRQLAFLWNLISRSRSEYKHVLQAAFSAILISVCNETRHWGYICDNTQPKSTRRVDALAAYFSALDRYVEAYKERDDLLGPGVTLPLNIVKVLTEDAATAVSKLKDESVDLVVTSPPYFGVCDYVKAQRLSMEWFELPLEPVRAREIGARSKRHRKTATSDYLKDMEAVIRQCARTVRRGGYIALVLGESTSRQAIVDDIKAILDSAEMKLVIDERRSVSIQRRQHPSIMEEQVIVSQRT